MLKLIISNGMAGAVEDCNNLAYLRTLGYAGSLDEAPKLKAGGSAHELLEAWMQGKTPDECLGIFKASYKEYSDLYVPDKGALSQLRWNNLDKILRIYLGLNALNSVEFDVIETERQLAIELYREPGLVILFSDKMDGKVRMHVDGSIASMEHKTGEFIDDKWFAKYDLDGQVTGHVAVGNATGDPVVGVVINAIQFAALPNLDDPTNVKKNGGYRSCKSHHIPIDQCHLDHAKFARRLFIRTADDIEMWKKEVIGTALRYHKLLVDGRQSLDGIHTVPMNGMMRGRCNTCEFKAFCRSHRNNRNLIFKRPPRESSVMSSGLFEVDDEIS